MKVREKDASYLQNQASVNVAHVNGLLENADDHAKAERILDDVEQYLPETVLEIGCRLGLVPWRIARSFPTTLSRGHVIGIDIVPGFIEIAEIRARMIPVECPLQFLVRDMHNLTFEDELFDYVFSLAVLEHSHDPETAMAEAFRVCRQRIYLEIDLEPKGKGGAHYTVETDPEDWLAMCPPGFTLRHSRCGSTLTIEGTRND